MRLASLDLPAPLFVGVVWASIVWLLIRRSRRPPFPPGPSPDPIIGNLRQMKSGGLEYMFVDWGKEYGEPPHGGVSFKVLIFRCRTGNPRVSAWKTHGGAQLI